MTTAGHKYMLVLYKFMLDRWWKAILTIGLILLIITAGLGALPLLVPSFPVPWVSDLSLWILGGLGGVIVVFALILVMMRRSAYVQPFADHVRLVTPFLKLNISYRRILKIFSTEMQELFPPAKQTRWVRDMLSPLGKSTVVVLDLTAFPISRQVMGMFLSPRFFPDKTPRLALLVPDWLSFTTELDSMRSAWQGKQNKSATNPGGSLYSEVIRPE